jgi:hypothetical protein
MRKQQEAFLKSMMVGIPGWGEAVGTAPAREASASDAPPTAEELAEIKRQFAELQTKLSKL